MRLCAPVRNLAAMSSKKECYFKTDSNHAWLYQRSGFDRHGTPDRSHRFDEGCVAGWTGAAFRIRWKAMSGSQATMGFLSQAEPLAAQLGSHVNVKHSTEILDPPVPLPMTAKSGCCWW